MEKGLKKKKAAKVAEMSRRINRTKGNTAGQKKVIAKRMAELTK